MKRSLLLFFILSLTCVLDIKAQIAIDDTTYSVEELVEDILLSPDSGAIISNIQFSGVYGPNNFYQISHFTTNTSTTTEMSISEGVLLTTGYSTDVSFPIGMDPGLEPAMGHIYDVCLPGQISQQGNCSTFYNDIDVLCGVWPYFNASILEFDFIPNSTFIEFNYVFGSEEYENIDGTVNYQCTEFNDKFGFIISGPNLSGGVGYDNDAINIARLENGSEVSINSVNNGVVGTGAFGDADICLENNPDWVENVAVNQYNGTIDGTKPNGNTNLLTAFQDGLIPNQTYHIKLIIADVSDGWLDSVVYLEGGSFNTNLDCDAGTNQILCNTDTTTINATAPSAGSWSVISGTGNFTDNTNPMTTVSNLSFGDNVLEWSFDDGTCSAQVTITNNSLAVPNFNPVDPICINSALNALPTTSINGISGTWSPAIDNTTTTTYTFTPNTDECASTQTLTIVVNPLSTPIFDEITPICNGDTLQELPSVSTNGISGIWTPALDNTNTSTYTFTPDNGECATSQTLTIVVLPNTAIFNEIAPICSGDPLADLPLVSNNGISGIWSPELNNMETTTYTFTPNAPCSDPITLTILVNQIPNFEITASCIDNNYTLQATTENHTNTLTLEWLDTNNNTIGSGSSIIVTEAGTYYLEVFDSNCSLMTSIDVTSAKCFIPEGISPNGDDKNDYFDLTGFNVKHLSIFNRYGVKVYEKANYIREWNGKSKNGKLLPTGTYFYVAEFIDKKSRIGWVYLNR